jgi:two-component system CheB/CheR fusion protein
MTDLGLLPLRLVYLLVVLIDFLRIDRSFIVGLGEDKGDKAIVSGTVSLAHALGVTAAVAEGVGTSDQAAILKGTGVRPGSGLLLRQAPPQRSYGEAAGRRHLLLAALRIRT